MSYSSSLQIFDFHIKFDVHGSGQTNSSVVADLRGPRTITALITEEISKVLPQYTVNVECTINEGSIIILGTVFLSLWTFFQPIVGESVKNAIEPDLTKAIQFALRRACVRMTSSLGISSLQSLQVDVVPSPVTSSTVNQTSTSQTNQDMPSIVASTTLGQVSPQQGIPRYLVRMIYVNTIGIVLIILILLILLIAPHLTILLK